MLQKLSVMRRRRVVASRAVATCCGAGITLAVLLRRLSRTRGGAGWAAAIPAAAALPSPNWRCGHGWRGSSLGYRRHPARRLSMSWPRHAVSSSPTPAVEKGEPHRDPVSRARATALCLVYVVLSASGPILSDWVKRHNGGRFPFSVPALTFHAWGIATCLGLMWTMLFGGGLKALGRPDMFWRFFVTTSLFTAGDILGFVSMQHLDVGTFSLVGKALNIVSTVALARVVLGKRQTRLQYGLVLAVVAATASFCRSEQHARHLVAATIGAGADAFVTPQGEWILGLVQRTAAVACTSLGAVLQERLFAREPSTHFMTQQCWMGCAAMAMSFFTLRCLHGLPTSHLVKGFNDWRVMVFLVTYIAGGLATGLMVKRLGAVAKALCVPIYLGGCYIYAVRTGSAVLTAQVVGAWAASTACILVFAVTKASTSAAQRRANAAPAPPMAAPPAAV